MRMRGNATSKLDYLKDLGVDTICITPCYPSPQVDFGYDVSDYENIDPMYGTLKDFDRLASEAKKRGIYIIMDFVMNHTSDKHKWFIDSESSKTSAHRNWYVWRDGKGPGQPPNNWLSTFGHSAWKFDPKTGQWYYHYFYPEQPDLNWRNPAVEKAMFDVTRWWYQRGVSGFRLDAVDTLFEDPDLRDNPILPGTNKYGDPNMQDKYNTKLPELHDVLRDLRKVADERGAVLIGETWTKDIDELKRYYGDHSNELQMPMDFLFARVDKLSPVEFRKQIAGVDAAGWPVYVLSNHDIVRAYNRYGDGQHNDQIAKVLALRHENAALRDGQYVPLNEGDQNVLSYLRRYKDEAVLVILNMSGSEQKVSFDLAGQGFASGKATTLLTTSSGHPKEAALSEVTLEPFAVYIGKLSK